MTTGRLQIEAAIQALGPVVVDAERSIRAIPVNTAARMEQTASPRCSCTTTGPKSW